MSITLSRKLVMVTAFAAAVFALGCKKEAKKDSPSDSGSPPVNPGGNSSNSNSGKRLVASAPPSGWCEVRDVIGGVRVFLPGDNPVVPNPAGAGGKENLATGCYATIRNPNINAEVKTFSLPLQAGAKLGSTPEDLLAGLKMLDRHIEQSHDVMEKTSATLDGKPALKIVVKKKPSSRPKIDAGDNPILAKMEAAEAERQKKEQAKRQVFYVTNTGTRVIIIQIDTPGEPDAAILKTVTDSFAFL